MVLPHLENVCGYVDPCFSITLQCVAEVGILYDCYVHLMLEL